MSQRQTDASTIIYDTANWDGIFCREIALRVLGGRGNCFVIGWESGDPPLRFPVAGNVCVLSLPLDATFGSLDAYDHYALWDRLTWVHNDPIAIGNTDSRVPGFRLAGVANCRLAWQWLVRAPYVMKEGLDPCVPTRSDFDNQTVVEPKCLPEVQDVSGFIWALEQEDEINWDLLLSSNAGKYLERLLRIGAKASMNRAGLIERIQAYITLGGLFNPESMDCGKYLVNAEVPRNKDYLNQHPGC